MPTPRIAFAQRAPAPASAPDAVRTRAGAALAPRTAPAPRLGGVRSTVLLAACLAPAACAAPRPADEPPGFDGSALSRHVEVLASDAFGGRFPGTAGEARTLAYLAGCFAAAGLQAPYDGGYLQDVPLHAVSLGRDSSLALASADGALRRDLAFPEEVLLAGGDGTTALLADSGLVFAGHGIVAPQHGWDDYAGLDVEGRTVVVLWGEPDGMRDGEPLFRGAALTEHGTPFAKRRLAASRGAAAVLTIVDVDALPVPWAVLADHALAPTHTLADASAPGDGLPRATLRDELARELLAAVGEDLDALRAGAAAGAPGRPLPLRATFELRAARDPLTTHNVVGVLPGRLRPDECIVYTAHWDHVGTRETAAGDQVFNGAVDNATGTAALIELARAFAARPQRPERSVVFLATTAEEQGLLGAHWHAEHPLFPLARTVAVINMDALFPFGPTKALTVVAPGQSELDGYLERAARRVGRRLVPDPAPEQGAFFRSDHYPFASRGVPAIFAVGGPDPDPASGETADVQRWVEYVTQRYHQPGDEYDASSWDMRGIVQDVAIFFDVGWALADSDSEPNWHTHSEFRALRDAQLGAARAAASRPAGRS